ncbi:type 1 fimbrial protein [Salmonella enterica]|nr:type 1 fimbrial protein [Salmonella enterica]ECI5354294.1 type 1 fimbrial protein [Salmonella enterica subsp. enterica]EDU6364209.1 type 1 fimbrial protein [Salmonella enterica subsp. enterica serovar Florian]EGX8053775.1 type 1 fimbrial protein [Salmonella enterica subsp. enterica serovar Inganda]EAX6603994.1 type 1 fimbrial protein [Salmonella enterica]
MKLRFLLPLLCCLLCTFTGKVFAERCFFENNENKTEISIPDFWASHDLIGPIGTNDVRQIMNPQSYWADVNVFEGEGTIIKCEGGNGSYIELTAPTDSTIIDQNYNMNGMGLIKTSVPGIVYSYQLSCTEGCVHGSNIDVSLPTAGQTNRSGTYNVDYAGSASRWNLRLDLYQTPAYRPRNGQTEVHAVAGTIGSVMMTGKGKTMHLNVSSGSALFTLQEPTCQRFGINGIENRKEVDFGEFFISDFDAQGVTPQRQFTLDLFGCSLNTLRIYVNGPHAENGETLTNQKGDAKGVGVRLAAEINNTWSPIKIDGTTPVGISFMGSTDWYQEQLSIPFAGQLRKIGTIEAGSFESTATFTIDYE